MIKVLIKLRTSHLLQVMVLVLLEMCLTPKVFFAKHEVQCMKIKKRKLNSFTILYIIITL